MSQARAVSVLGVLAVATLTLLATTPAEAHGRRGRRVVVAGGWRGAYAPFGHGWGFYSPFFDPYWAWGGPYAGPQGGVDMNVAMMAGWGAVAMDVKPGRADVWVDGKYVGEARDLDGYPSYLWLEQGTHRVAVFKAGYRTFDEEVEVSRGMKRALKLRLEPGPSLPPGPKPAGGERGGGQPAGGSVRPKEAAPAPSESD
jgi:hypothetical protein